MNVVDSCGWLEYLGDGSNAAYFAAPIQDTQNLLVPAICLYEVFKTMKLQRGQQAALQAVGILYSGQVVELSGELALHAAQLSLTYKLPMADSFILAVAEVHGATVWTQDEHFKGLPGVRFIEK
mgnify:CR=1 FL=1